MRRTEKPEARPKVEATRGSIGTYIAYGAKGEEIWRQENFRIGEDMVPGGVSMTMSAGIIVDSSTGARLHRWDPWKVLQK